MKTKKEKINKKQKVMDAEGKALGRLASSAAMTLMGKDSSAFQRHIYSGSPVKIINASKLKITAEKLGSITHKRYSGYPGGLKEHSAAYVAKKKGYGEILRHAIKKMLPDNKLRKEMMKNLTIEE